MNARSLKLRLIAWYAGLLAVCFALLGGMTYFTLQRSLVEALKETQLRRARQIAQLLREEIQRHQEGQLGQEVETRYAPGLNGRFVRVSRRDGAILYLSSAPTEHNFDPALVPPPAWPSARETAGQTTLPGGRSLLLVAQEVRTLDGAGYLVETAAPMDEVQAELRKWLASVLGLLLVGGGIAVGGGYVLVKRALLPVDRITASAERISSHNLSERLPVARTGDEFERLSLALNRMIERLDQAFQHSRRFVADASHELRTPLTVLRGEVESLLQEPGCPAEWRDRLGSALEEVDRLANIVEGLFAISRLDAGEAAAERMKFDLGNLAVTTADQMALLAEDRQIVITCELANEVWVEGDRARLKQVVVNLLDNAIKYTPEGGTVTVSVRTEANQALLEVADTGIGIPAEALPRLFERFFRVDEARSRAHGGAGLGLSIVKSICDAHRGDVQASSAPGEGSRFQVRLPLAYSSSNRHPERTHHEL